MPLGWSSDIEGLCRQGQSPEPSFWPSRFCEGINRSQIQFWQYERADDRDFLYWFITDNGVDTDENEDDYRAPLVFDINWRKIREAIYQTLLHEGFIVNCRYKKLGDFPYNPDSHQEYQYWLCNIALPTDLI